ncbi:MAG TPA: 30S ribosomal protein S5 [Patescibacteria group bacterium]|jgi:small subunit ribosomal protein S5
MADKIMITPDKKEFEEKVIQVSRVSKKTKGGNQIGFSVLMVVGDKQGKVGVGLGKAPDVLSAIKKGIKKAKKQLITVPLDGTTIPFQMMVKKGAGQVLLKPASSGTGVIAGGPVRAVVEAAGVRDISAKILGSENQASSVYATFEALKRIERIVNIRGIKLRSIVDIEREEKEKMKRVQEQAKQQANETDRIGKKTAPVQKKSVAKQVGRSGKQTKKKPINQPAG